MTRPGLALLCATLLTACTGGGGSGPTPPPAGTVTVTVSDPQYNLSFTYAAPAGFQPRRDAMPGFTHSGAEQATLAAINAERARGGTCPTGTFAPAGPLRFEGHLHRAAALYGQELAASSTLNLPHRSARDGRVPSQRMVDAGYRPVPPAGIAWVFGESLAAGAALELPAEVIAAWKASPDHCAALFEDIEDGAVARISGAAGTYWVLNIAGW